MSLIKHGIEFHGVLATVGNQFIAHKRVLGRKYSTEEKLMCRLCELAEGYGLSDESLPKAFVEEWSKRHTGESIKSHSNRLSFTRQFAHYLILQGKQAYVPGPYRARRSTYVPYIFSHEEINKFFVACDSLPPTKHTNQQMQRMLPVIFRILYGCGLRVSEALALQIRNFDFTANVFIVKESKFDKDRIIPMSPSLSGICAGYMTSVRSGAAPEALAFPNHYGNMLAPVSIYGRFREILWRAGIPFLGKGVGPRLHDIRHTFAVHSLQNWAASGLDIDAMLPVLSAYLGHQDATSTGRYVRLTADVFPELVAGIERVCGHVIPEVEDDETD